MLYEVITLGGVAHLGQAGAIAVVGGVLDEPRRVPLPFRCQGNRAARERGDLLVALDDAEYRALVASSVAQAKLDAQRLARAEDLYKKKFIV